MSVFYFEIKSGVRVVQHWKTSCLVNVEFITLFQERQPLHYQIFCHFIILSFYHNPIADCTTEYSSVLLICSYL